MPCNYKDYPNNWKVIRKNVMERSGGRCELCNAENYKPHWKTGSKVILTVHHIDYDKKNNTGYNLLALCQRCHNKLDMPFRVKNRKRNISTETEFVRRKDVEVNKNINCDIHCL